jgi:GAF domain-containing protein
VISLSIPGEWRPDSEANEFLEVFADTCAQALERLQARAEAADTSARLEFLAAASAELASSLDYQATLATVARLAVPTVADWCAVEILDDGRLRTLAVAHVDPAKIVLAEQLQQQYPTDPESTTGSQKVVRTGISELYAEITDEMLVGATRDEEHLRLSRALRLHSALVVPLIARGRTLGAITFVSAESGRTYQPTDVRFAEDLARRAAVAIDNAHLHSETREAAVRLQRAVLPQTLDIPGWELAAVYSPSGRTEVGGDFYDAVRLDDGRLAVVIGDVMGRGVAAAAAMARMRSAIHAYIATDPDPEVVVTKLDRMFAMFHPSRMVTMVYLLIAAGAHELTMVNAGHCPPLLVHPDGDVEFLRPTPAPPIGVAEPQRRASTHSIPPGSVLLVFTDGLVERRGEDLDAGLERVARHAAALAASPLASSLPLLVDVVRDTQRDDDIAALALRERLAG